MTTQEDNPVLRNLDLIDIECLALGRITCDTMREAVWRLQTNEHFTRANLGLAEKIPSYSDMLLADELNDMLEAARETHKKGD